jgi:hypothetical protein
MWINVIENPNPINAIYSEVPSLENVVLHEINLKENGSKLKLTFDFNEFPVSCPKKWEVSKFNTVQVCIEFWDICELKMEGWGNASDVTISMEIENSGLQLKINGTTTLTCCAGGADISKISAYQNT